MSADPKPKPPSKAARKRAKFGREFCCDARVAFVRNLRCPAYNTTPCENHHIESGGTSYKAHYTKIAPLSFRAHQEVHLWGRKTFEERHGIDLEVEAAYTDTRWLLHCMANGLDPETGAALTNDSRRPQ